MDEQVIRRDARKTRGKEKERHEDVFPSYLI